MARRKRRKHVHNEFFLNLNALMDILTVLLFFLLQNFSVEAPYSPNSEMHLPKSISVDKNIDALKVVATRSVVAVGDTRVASIVDDKLVDPDTNKIIPGNEIPLLRKQLDIESDKTKKIMAADPQFALEKKDFEGRLILEADATLPYHVIRKIMYTAGATDYVLFKFAIVRADQ